MTESTILLEKAPHVVEVSVKNSNYERTFFVVGSRTAQDVETQVKALLGGVKLSVVKEVPISILPANRRKYTKRDKKFWSR